MAADKLDGVSSNYNEGRIRHHLRQFHHKDSDRSAAHDGLGGGGRGIAV